MRAPNTKSACMLGYFVYESDPRVQNYANILLRAGISVDVICVGNSSTDFIAPSGATLSVHAVRQREEVEKSRMAYVFNLMLFFLSAMSKVSVLHLRKNYRFIHVHNVPDFLVFTAWVPKLMRANVLLDIHDILPELYARKYDVALESLLPRLLLLIEKISCRFADHVIVANETWRQRLIERSVPPQKCTCLPNFPDLNLFHSENGSPASDRGPSFRILYHGSITEHHGLDIAIKAIDILRHRIGPFEFLLYGSGPREEQIRVIIHTLGLEHVVEIRKEVPLNQVPELIKNADIGIVPKRDGVFSGEALSTKLFEYAAMGLPAVVSRTEAEKRYFDEDEVMYFTPGDPADMARCIERLYRDAGLRQSLARRALSKGEKYSLTENARKYMSLVGSAGDGSGPPTKASGRLA